MQACAVEKVGPDFMKHRPSTSRKYYLMAHQNREAIRYSMKCYTSFLSNPKDVERYSKNRDQMLKRGAGLPSLKRMTEFLKDWFVAFGSVVGEDKGLLASLKDVFTDSMF